MSNYLDLFAEHLRGTDRSEHTVEAYTGDVAAFFAWLAERLSRNAEPVEVTTFDLQKYRQALLDQGRKPAGINRRLAALRTFFDWAIDARLATANPVQTLQGVKQDRRVPKALSAQEVYRLQRTAASQRQLAAGAATGRSHRGRACGTRQNAAGDCRGEHGLHTGPGFRSYGAGTHIRSAYGLDRTSGCQLHR
jgi:site-specific recombinase XerD